MKCISLWQPWASLIFGEIKPDLFKRWETRSWSTSYRGPLLIHAAQKHFSERDAKVLFRDMGIGDYFHNWRGMPYGAILGKVELVDCISTNTNGFYRSIYSSDQLRLGNYGPDRFAWKLENPVLFKTPIPYKGQQGLFNVPDELIERAA